MKFSGGGVVGGVVGGVGCSLLIWELFQGLPRQTDATSFANELFLLKNKLEATCVHQSAVERNGKREIGPW